MKTKLARLFLTLMIFYSCGTGTNRKEAASEAALMDVSMENSSAPPPITNESMEKIIDRKIIKQGEITFESRNINETATLISKAVGELEGYISDDNIYNNNERITHRFIIRVPADKFDLLLDRISGYAEKLDSKSVTAQDVTVEYIDVESRIKTKKELENKYRELLKKAKTVEDILSIEKEMGTLRTEIESIEGRLKYLKDRVNFSTLTVEFYQRTNSAFNFSSKFGQAIVMGWKWLLAFIIGMVHLWPFIVIIAAGITLGITFRRKRLKRKVV